MTTIVVKTASSGSGGGNGPIIAAIVTGVVLVIVALINNWSMASRDMKAQDVTRQEAKNDREAADKRATADRVILANNASRVAESAQVTNLLATYKWAAEIAFDKDPSKGALGAEALGVLGQLPEGSLGVGGMEMAASTLELLEEWSVDPMGVDDSSGVYPSGV